MTDRAADFAMLDKQLAAEYDRHRPGLIAGFAAFVYKQGPRATWMGKSWQAIGRSLYGKDFNVAFAALVERK